MKAIELEIGDWVFYVTKPVQVLQLDESADYKEIHPIPMTQNTAEKIGFENQGFFGLMAVEGKRCLYDGQRLVIINEEENRKMVEIDCQFVHQLQHALKLCGINMDFVL